jgi:hypothetical protein
MHRAMLLLLLLLLLKQKLLLPIAVPASGGLGAAGRGSTLIGLGMISE